MTKEIEKNITRKPLLKKLLKIVKHYDKKRIDRL